jgi:hypothetical protein
MVVPVPPQPESRSASRNTPRRKSYSSGRAQLSLVEHALCPLDSAVALRDHLVHETAYGYTDRHGHLKIANVRVTCSSGLSAADEFVLWGLLALTFAQPEPSTEFHATPHYCLRKLGLIERNTSKGGKDYLLFRESIRRLARVIYESTAFYDPLRGERRDMAFGFLKYSLPIDSASSRAWRFVWDQQFFEFCQATGGSLWFDLATYRKLDFASRRLFVFLQKVFHRSPVSPSLDVQRLCVDVLGFAPTVAVRDLKFKLARCIARLASQGIVEADHGAGTWGRLYEKHGVGLYSVILRRGSYFSSKRLDATKLSPEDSALVDPLRGIGLDDAAIRRVLQQYPTAVVREWADITLAAKERQGASFFTKSAAAYFIDNVQHAAAGRRTAPDWWRELRRQELERQRAEDRQQMESLTAKAEEQVFREYLAGKARDAFEQVMQQTVNDLMSHGKSRADAEESGTYMATLHFRHRFRREHPEFRRAAADFEMSSEE